VTESWGTLRVDLANSGSEDRQARVVVFYPEQPEVQFARDILVPRQSLISSWMTIGPAPQQRGTVGRELQVLLYDRTGGRERLLLPFGGERVRSHAVFYRPREPSTAVLLDEASDESGSVTPEPVVLARSLRAAANLSEAVNVIYDRLLPAVPEAFEGIDVLILASNGIAADPAARRTLRHWVQQGGKLWVLLDHMDPAVVAPLLGDDFDLTVIDRIGETTTRLCRAVDDPAAAHARNFEQPVELVRVSLGGKDSAIHTVNGWPASFGRTVGRGQVIFTTLGARAWYRPRTARDPRAKFANFPDSPVPLGELEELAARFYPRGEATDVPSDALREMVLQELGYSVTGRGTASAIFGGFLLAAVGLGIVLRRSRHPELAGWAAPAAAIGAAIVFLLLGQEARRTVPPTVGFAALVEAVPGSGEAAARGVAAIYRPDSGAISLGTDSGATLDLDAGGLEGHTRRRVVTGLDEWHWENLNLPAGVRTGTFRSTIPHAGLSAIVRFGSDGVEGRLGTGSFHGLSDGLVITQAHDSLPVRFGASNMFSLRDEDSLAPGQFLTAAVLTNRQQRRQAVYQRLLGESVPKNWDGRDLLLAWAEPGEIPFQVGETDRVIGTALLAIPLEFERPPPETRVTVPRAFVPYSRILVDRRRSPTLDGSTAVEMELRFQVPPSVLPLAAERVRLSMRIRAPGRNVSVSGFSGKELVPLFGAENPLDPIVVEIADPRFLHLDAEGGLHLMVKVSDPTNAPEVPTPKPGVMMPPPVKGQPKGKIPPPPVTSEPLVKAAAPQITDLLWKIESLGLEVVGRTGPER
jgi:hypothetical protein